MIQVVGLRILLGMFAWLVLGLVVIGDWITASFGIPVPLRYAVLISEALLVLLTIKAVWTSLWRWVPQLNRWVFPDLNGQYDVVVRSNWPVVEQTLTAAQNGNRKFDPLSQKAALPELQTTKLIADIDLSWLFVRVNMCSADSSDPSQKIRESRTLSAQIVRSHGATPPQLFYVYEQSNQTQELSDDRKFYGSALLEVVGKDFNTLKGEYWTNRSWRRGLNVAGEITLSKR